MRTAFAPMLAAALLAMPVAAGAATATDPAGDFLASYTGARNADLDLLGASVLFDGTNFTLSSTSAGAIGASPGSLFVWGINRGAGTPRLSFGTPGIGPGVLFDAVAVFFPDGTGRTVTFPAIGAPTITPLTGAVSVGGNTISGVVPLARLSSTGFAPGDYTFTLWSRLRVNPVADGTNAEVADFAPRLTASVPEPASWAMIIVGFAATGAAMRRRRTPLLPA